MIYFIELGGYTFKEIANLCKIDIKTVKKIIDNYDKFYVKMFNNKKNK